MSSQVEVRITVNGTEQVRTIEPRMLLVHFLREELKLTGTHIGCDTSNCGSCTVLLEGAAIKSCTTLAVQADGRSLTTMEGLGPNGRLGPVQEAFREQHGLQCGYCTPGMVMCATDLLSHNASPSDHQVRHALAGNLCRCTGYQSIVDSVQAAALKLQAQGGDRNAS